MKRYYTAMGFAILVAAKGLGFPAFEIGLSEFPVLFLAAIRYDVALILVGGYVFATDTDWKPTTRGDYLAIGSGGFFAFTLATALWGIGQELTTSTLAALMSSLIPILTAGISWLLIPEDRLSTIGIIGLLMGFTGALVILIPGTGLEFGPGMQGKIMMFIGVGFGALGAVLIRWSKPSLPASSQTGWALLLSAISLHAISLFVEDPIADSKVTLAGIMAVLFLGVVVSAIGRGVQFWLLGRCSAIEISITSYISPVIAGIVGWIVFSDNISVSMIVGFLVVMAGFGLMKRNLLRKEFYRIRGHR